MKKFTLVISGLLLTSMAYCGGGFLFPQEKDEPTKEEKEQQIKDMIEKYVISKAKGPNGTLIFSDKTAASKNTINELDKPLTVIWEDETLSDVIDELRDITKLNIVIHKEVPRDTLISIRMKDVKTSNVLKWVLRSIEQKASIDEGVIVIAPADKIINSDLSFVVHDISDLTLTIKDFPATELQRNLTGIK